MSTFDLNPLSKDIYGAEAPGNPEWALGIEDGVLALRGVVRARPVCIAEDSENCFVEGLWEADVVELFLLNPNTGFYVEFNLGPRGAWWFCSFDSPRKRTPVGPVPIPGVKTYSAPSETGWDSTLTVPLGSLPLELAFAAGVTKGNINFCLGTPQQFITLADLGDGEPDFHRPDKWIALKKILIPSRD
jgi:hypothetical protein